MWHTAITSRVLSLAYGVWIHSTFCQCVPAYSARVADTGLRKLLREKHLCSSVSTIQRLNNEFALLLACSSISGVILSCTILIAAVNAAASSA